MRHPLERFVTVLNFSANFRFIPTHSTELVQDTTLGGHPKFCRTTSCHDTPALPAYPLS